MAVQLAWFQKYRYGSKLTHQELDRRFWSMFPFTIPCWVHILDPQLYLQMLLQTSALRMGGLLATIKSGAFGQELLRLNSSLRQATLDQPRGGELFFLLVSRLSRAP